MHGHPDTGDSTWSSTIHFKIAPLWSNWTGVNNGAEFTLGGPTTARPPAIVSLSSTVVVVVQTDVSLQNLWLYRYVITGTVATHTNNMSLPVSYLTSYTLVAMSSTEICLLYACGSGLSAGGELRTISVTDTGFTALGTHGTSFGGYSWASGLSVTLSVASSSCVVATAGGSVTGGSGRMVIAIFDIVDTTITERWVRGYDDSLFSPIPLAIMDSDTAAVIYYVGVGAYIAILQGIETSPHLNNGYFCGSLLIASCHRVSDTVLLVTATSNGSDIRGQLYSMTGHDTSKTVMLLTGGEGSVLLASQYAVQISQLLDLSSGLFLLTYIGNADRYVYCVVLSIAGSSLVARQPVKVSTKTASPYESMSAMSAVIGTNVVVAYVGATGLDSTGRVLVP